MPVSRVFFSGSNNGPFRVTNITIDADHAIKYALHFSWRVEVFLELYSPLDWTGRVVEERGEMNVVTCNLNSDLSFLQNTRAKLSWVTVKTLNSPVTCLSRHATLT